MKRIFAWLIAVLAAGFAVHAWSQAYPSKTIRIIASFPPGGGIDGSARITALALTESLGQQVIVDNRPGAGGQIGTELAAKARPDGYTLLMGSSGPNAVIPAVNPKLPYSVSDFTPISLVATSDFLLVVHPSLPVKSVKDLIALARSNPGKIGYISTGNLGGPHLAAELFKMLAKVDMMHVAYKGGGPQVTALISGEVPVTFATLPASLAHVKAGRMRALGISGSKRNSALPDVPAIAEFLRGYETRQWYGVLAPAGTPREIVMRLHSEIAKALNTRKIQEQLANIGFDAAGTTPEEFAALIQNEMEKWGKVVKAARVSLD